MVRRSALVTRLLRGTRAVMTELAPFLAGAAPPVRILDVATGFAGLPRAIVMVALGPGFAAEGALLRW